MGVYVSKLTDFCDCFIEQTLPMVAAVGCNYGSGPLIEQVKDDWSITEVGFQRSMLHGRQLYVFSTWGTLLANPSYLAFADYVYESLVQHFPGEKPGSWVDKVSADKEFLPIDASMSLYSHAFVIFGMATYASLRGSKEANAHIQSSLKFLDQFFLRNDASGLFYSQLNAMYQPATQQLLQNPHMHLFEALLQLYALTKRQDVLFRLKQLYQKFIHSFLHGHAIIEKAFSNTETDITIEPGHLAEWAWLMRWADTLFGETLYVPTGQQLLQSCVRFGWDQAHGGIFDILSYPDLQVVKESKRLWPQLELIKALLAYPKDDTLQTVYGCSIENVAGLLMRYYMKMDGSWFEHLQKDLQPELGVMPLSSIYHMSMAVLQARGVKELPPVRGR